MAFPCEELSLRKEVEMRSNEADTGGVQNRLNAVLTQALCSVFSELEKLDKTKAAGRWHI